jgi:hypothetical protein
MDGAESGAIMSEPPRNAPNQPEVADGKCGSTSPAGRVSTNVEDGSNYTMHRSVAGAARAATNSADVETPHGGSHPAQS